jgi:signal transduction histidine kinase
MGVETGTDVIRLLAALRDLVTLSAIPAASGGREPAVVAAELADALAALLQLDFAFVRLRDLTNGEPVDATRGAGWERFPEWLDAYEATPPERTATSIVDDIGAGPVPYRGLVVPIGVDRHGGLLAAASARRDFPTDIEQLMLSLAANQAATSYRNARLVEERAVVEEQLRAARDDLEMKVAARTAEVEVANTELAALRRVATLIAKGVQSSALFAVVAEEVARVIDVPIVSVVSYEPDGSATECASHSDRGPRFTVGARWSLGGTNVLRVIKEHPEPARIDDYAGLEGEIAEAVRAQGIRSTVGNPIIVAGQLWGAMVVSTDAAVPLPHGTEARLADFTELLATAIANAESRAALARIAGEQAALRRVATLVAQGVPPAEIFSAVSDEVEDLFGCGAVALRYEHDGPAVVFVGVSKGIDYALGARWGFEDGMASADVYRTGRSARADGTDWSRSDGPLARAARRMGIVSIVASPIVVEGRLWGAMTLASSGERLPPDTEARLENFSELVATAIANAQSRDALARLAQEQASLRRVATLVVQGVQPSDIFSAVSDEVRRLFGTNTAAVVRFEHDPPTLVIAGIGAGIRGLPVGTRAPLDDGLASTTVYRTGRSARVDERDWELVGEPLREPAENSDLGSTIASPITVDGRVWGAINVSAQSPLPPGAEERLERFAELLSIAMANAESRAALARLADEQAALRRVATLVARGVPPAVIFTAVSDEVDGLFGCGAGVMRFEHDGPGIVVVGASKSIVARTSRPGAPGVPMGRWSPLEDGMASTEVYRTGRSARVDARDWGSLEGPMRELTVSLGLDSSVASPITVDGHLWGTMNVAADEPLPAGTEERLERFSDLVASAIANAESREAVRRLADEQAALRRVATLVARGVAPSEIFNAVSDEVSQLLGTDSAYVGQFDADGPSIIAAGVATSVTAVDLGARWALDDSMSTAAVFRTGQAARVDGADYSAVDAPVGALAQRLGTSCAVSSPIIVDGRLWGAVSVAARNPLPLDAEERLEKFTDLVATALANAEAREEVAASRRRIVAASDEARRRIERNLHDGTQQRLVTLGLAARAAEANVPPALHDLRAELSHLATGLGDAVAELQEVSRGIHPANLSERGLTPALRTLVRRSPLPVDLDITVEDRLPEPIEVAAYYVASEALANAAKHAQASHVEVSLSRDDGEVLLSIRDDGVGGADAVRGSGLVGLTDRVEALGGTVDVRSTPGDGTRITAVLPLASGSPTDGE